jgi:hypothetical protein
MEHIGRKVLHFQECVQRVTAVLTNAHQICTAGVPRNLIFPLKLMEFTTTLTFSIQ